MRDKAKKRQKKKPEAGETTFKSFTLGLTFMLVSNEKQWIGHFFLYGRSNVNAIIECDCRGKYERHGYKPLNNFHTGYSRIPSSCRRK